MKKKFLTFFFVFTISLFGICSHVKAEEYTSYSVDYKLNFINDSGYLSYSEWKTFLQSFSDPIHTYVSNVLDIYNSSYSEQYPYYYFGLSISQFGQYHNIYINFLSTDVLPSVSNSTSHTFSVKLRTSQCTISDNPSNPFSSSCSSPQFTDVNDSYNFFSSDNNGTITAPFFSNFSLYWTGLTQNHVGYTVTPLSSQYEFSLDSSAPVPIVYDLFELTFLNDYTTDTYTTVNLNDYSYIILSYMDYDNFISPIIFDVKGQLCLTSAYDYGQTASDNQQDICTVVYDDFAPVRLYEQYSDFIKHPIYYIKAQDTSIPNVIKVNTSIFNITYLTPSNEADPIIYVNGRPYSPIAFNNLPETANSLTDNGYIPGAVCAVGDLGCYQSQTGIDIDDLFTDPLTLLQSVWTSITGIFVIITSFIALMPPTLQAFLFTAFMLAVVLGVLKILIG